jgi:hypothetical protein
MSRPCGGKFCSDCDWCDDTPKCPVKEREEKGDWPWTRQIATIRILPEDAVSDDGQEIYNLFEQRGIRNVIMTGVHLNRCVLGRRSIGDGCDSDSTRHNWAFPFRLGCVAC